MSVNSKKYLYLFFFLCLPSAICFPQDITYKDNGYERDAMNYVMDEVERTNSTLEDCLKYTKPFSKWNLQSLKSPEVWIFDNLQSSGTFPNLLFGALAKRFDLSIYDAKEMPNKFLQNAVDDYEVYQKDAIDNANSYFELIDLLKKSGAKIFLNQDNLKRVDDVFYENNIYWKYAISENSPFPVSDSVITVQEEFLNEDFVILGKMNSLGIYAVYKDNPFIYLLKDGMLDNSYGYYFRDNDINYYKENHLFNLMAEEPIMPRFYYYIAN